MHASGFFLVLCVVGAAFAADFTGSFSGVVGNNTFAFSNGTFTTPATLKGAVTVSVSTVLSSDVQVCFQPVSPAVGADLAHVCNPKTFGAAVNSTGEKDLELKFTRKSFSAFSSTKRMSNRFAHSARAVQDDEVTTQVMLAPSTAYYVTVAAPDADDADLVTVEFTGATCNQNKMGPNCVNAPENIFNGPNDMQTVPVPAGDYVYVAPAIAQTWGGVSWNVKQADGSDETDVVQIFAGAGFLPDKDNYADAFVDDEDGTTLSLHNPYGPTWYVALFNSGADDHVVNVTQTASVCESPMYDFNCTRNVNDIGALNAGNITAVFKEDAPDDDDDENIAYYKIVNTHCCGVPADATYVRVSVAPQGSGDGPTLYARQGYPPSKSFYDFNATGEYVNQLILPIIPKAAVEAAGDFNPYAWYVAVEGDENYAIWVGGNCAGNCSDEKNGYCTCDGHECNPKTLWRLPTTADDSFGRCTCDKYTNYDCTNNNDSSSSTFKTIYIILIAVGGAIVLAVAIGVPVYCYLQNRKRNNYQRF